MGPGDRAWEDIDAGNGRAIREIAVSTVPEEAVEALGLPGCHPEHSGGGGPGAVKWKGPTSGTSQWFCEEKNSAATVGS
jgi:hypothetical protein